MATVARTPRPLSAVVEMTPIPSSNGHKRPQVTKEIIGRVSYKRPYAPLLTVDRSQTDYAFWDRLRAGKALGYEIGGLFAQPLAEMITAYVVGGGVGMALVDDDPRVKIARTKRDYTNSFLSRLTNFTDAVIRAMIIDDYALGDQYVIVNPDGSLSVPSPDTVDPQYNPLDYRDLQGVTVTTKLEEYEITDTYTAQKRTLAIKVTSEKAAKRDGVAIGTVKSQDFANLIGRLPVVHFPCDRRGNEEKGHPIYEALLPLLSRYDDLFMKGMDGAELMSNPIPVITGLEDPETFAARYAPTTTEQYYDVDANLEDRAVFNMETRAGFLLGIGTDFKFVGPQAGFTNDLRAMLKLCFLLIIDHMRVNEPMWGGAVPYQSGAEEQMDPFYQFVLGRRVALEGTASDASLNQTSRGGLLELFEILLAMYGLTDPRLAQAPVRAKWAKLSEEAMAEIRAWVVELRKAGALTRERMLELSGLVEDVDAEITAADKEAEEMRDQVDPFTAKLNAAVARARGGGQQGDQEQNNPPPDNQPQK